MKRPIIKGTPLHKASIAKAKTESIVSQRRTQADSSLVAAGNVLGESYIPAVIDFSIDQKAIKIPKSEEDKGKNNSKTKKDLGKTSKKTKVKEKYDDSGLVNPEAEGGDYNLEINYPEEDVKKKDIKKKKVKDVLINDTESADSKYVAPYVDEAEDKDNDYSGIENDNSDPTDGSTSAKNKPYKNWKVRENEKNIADAEANKAKADAASAKRVAEANAKAKADAEAKKNNTNFNYNLDNNSDIVAQEVPKTKPKTKSKVKVDPSVSAAETKAKKEFDNRDKTVVSTIKPKNIEQIPNNISEQKLEQAGTAPKGPKEKVDADKNPDYTINKPSRNLEGGTIDFGGSTNSPGYNYDEDADQWSYNGINISDDEVSTEAYAAIMKDVMRREQEETQGREKEKQTNLNSNTPSNDSTSVDLLPQQQAVVDNKTTPPQARTREQKENDKIYNDFRTSNYKKRKMIEEGYSPIQSKSPMEMRDNRIYRNAQVDGPVRKNMIKGGYTPK